MKILNFGSINRDYVHSVSHIVKAGETLSCLELPYFFGRARGLTSLLPLHMAGLKYILPASF